MKKKLVAVLLASTMALSLSACGGSDSSNNSSKSETTQEKPTEKEEHPLLEPLLDRQFLIIPLLLDH